MYNCATFIEENNFYELSVNELYEVSAVGNAFFEAIKRWDSSQGVYFLQYWRLQQYGDFCKVYAKYRTEKAMRTKGLSLDAQIRDSADSISFLDMMKDTSSSPLERAIDKENELFRLLNEFVEQDLYGNLIEREMMGKKAKSVFTAECFQIEKAGKRERQIAERTRLRFRKFCEKRGFDVRRYLEEK